MMSRKSLIGFIFPLLLLVLVADGFAQQIKWAKDGNAFYMIENNSIILNDLSTNSKILLVNKEKLSPSGGQPIKIRDFSLSEDGKKVLIYTNSRFVWRIDTQGDYWVLEHSTGKLQQVGPQRLPAS